MWVVGALVAFRGHMVLLMKNLSRSEGSHREEIYPRIYCLGVPLMSYLGSSEMVQVVTLVNIYGTR